MKNESLPFVYATKNSFAADGTVTPNIVISNDSDFLLQEIRVIGSLDPGDLLLSIGYAQGDVWNNISFDASTIQCNANANNALKFLQMPLIPRNTQINVQMQNASGAALLAEVQLWGVKLYKEQ